MGGGGPARGGGGAPRAARPNPPIPTPPRTPLKWTAGIPGQWLSLRLGIDLYNASDAQPDQNLLQWTAMPRGWEVTPQPTPIPALSTYRVQRYAMDARYNLTAVDSRGSRGAGAGAGGV